MSTTPAHNKIINAVARSALNPIGVKQKGQSRLWLDDRKWYALAIEFQPSRWAKGSYLNLSVSWLWYPQNFWSFDMGGRAEGFTEYRDDTQFTAASENLATKASDYIIKMRDQLSSLEAAYSMVDKELKGDWPAFHTGVLAAITGKPKIAREYLSLAYEESSELDYVKECSVYIAALMDRIDDVKACAQFVEDQIILCRTMLKLPELDRPILPNG